MLCRTYHAIDSATRLLIEDTPTVPTIHGQISLTTQAPPHVLPHYDPRYDDTVPTPATFFDPDEYDDDGRPFEMKIHLKGESNQAWGGQGMGGGRRTRKCRAGAEGNC